MDDDFKTLTNKSNIKKVDSLKVQISEMEKKLRQRKRDIKEAAGQH
jgi:hypothetical protein